MHSFLSNWSMPVALSLVPCYSARFACCHFVDQVSTSLLQSCFKEFLHLQVTSWLVPSSWYDICTPIPVQARHAGAFLWLQTEIDLCMIPQALAGELCPMMADHQEHKPRPQHTRTWNKLFLAVALSLVLNPAKGSKGENFELYLCAGITFSCCLLSARNHMPPLSL